MNSVLDEILAQKRKEVDLLKAAAREGWRLKRRAEPVSLIETLNRPGINVIAEIKYRSPSHGPSRCQLEPTSLASSYLDHGARALSVLTDECFFGGAVEHLAAIHRRFSDVPLLRKDFIIDWSQIEEAYAAGASAFLLITGCLEAVELARLIEFGERLGMEALVEVHDAWELERAWSSGARLIGVNNRNLKTFEVSLETAFQIARYLEGERDVTLVAESGIENGRQILELRDAGYRGFLIGSALMNADDPGQRLAQLLREAQ